MLTFNDLTRLPDYLQEAFDARDMVKLLRLLEPNRQGVEMTLSEIEGRLGRAGFDAAPPEENEGTGFTPALKAE